MIDLHIHTVFSDGTDSVKEILQKAEKLKLEIISITDHDNVDAYEELKKIDVKSLFSGRIIPGVEIKTIFNNTAIEVLAYDFDIDKVKELPIFDSDRTKKLQAKYLEQLKNVGKKLGLTFNEDIKITDYAAPTFYDELIKYKENIDILPELKEKREKFYRLTQSNKKSPFFIDETEDSTDINYIIDKIHQYGGKVFLAHLYQYKLDNYNQFIIDIFKNTNLDGIECYYSTFTDEQINKLLEFCKQHDKVVCGGSDYHGENKKTISLGVGEGNLNIPKEIVNWIK